MANRNVDALHAAEAEATATKIKGRIADARANLKVLERQLVIAEEMANDAKVEQ